MNDIAIRLENLQKCFGQIQALSDIELEVRAGSVMGILGSKRSGKTTIIHILATLLMPNGGRAVVAGHDTRTSTHEVRQQIGLASKGNVTEQHLTGHMVLTLMGRLHGLNRRSSRRQADELLARFDLGDVASVALSALSKFEQRRLDLAACLTGKPSVILIDEPTFGIESKDQPVLWDLIHGLTGGGMTVFITSSNMDEVVNLADRVAILHDGRIVTEDNTRQLKNRLGRTLDITASDHHATATIVQYLGDMIDDRSRIRSVDNIISITHSTPDLIIGIRDRLVSLGFGLSRITVREPTPEEAIRLLTAPLDLVDELDIRGGYKSSQPGGSDSR